MKEKIIEFADLSDSSEMLEANTPNFITFFIVLILSILLVALAWMWFGEIDVIIKANGMVRPGKTISVVRSASGGELEEVNYYSGKSVQAGDVLYKVDDNTLLVEKRFVNNQIEDIKRELYNLEILMDSIEKGKNLFVQKNTVENSFHYQNRYLNFKKRYQQLQLEYNRAEKNFERERSLGEAATTKSRLQDLESEVNYARLNLERYVAEKILRIEEQIRDGEKELEELKHRNQKLEENIELTTKKAPISGVVQSIQDFNRGDYLPAGVEVLRIIPQSETDYRMELTVANEDISKLELGQEVRYRFLSLPYREYGILTGEITQISGDITTAGNLEGGGNPQLPYESRASINKVTLENNQGEKVQIKPGMICEARIVVRSRKILYVVLEKLDFLS